MAVAMEAKAVEFAVMIVMFDSDSCLFLYASEGNSVRCGDNEAAGGVGRWA